MSRTSRIAATVAALAISLTACGGSSSSSSSASADTSNGGTTPIESADPTFQPISAGKLTVCSDVPYPPFEFQDDAGKWTGFDIDIISAVAQRYGLTVEVSKQPFDSILVAVGAGTCDLVASAVTITEERAKNVLFSDAYFDADQSLLVRTEDAETYVAFERAVKRFGARIIDKKSFVPGNDPRQREVNNVALMTSTTSDYDVVFVADFDGEFARGVAEAIRAAKP